MTTTISIRVDDKLLAEIDAKAKRQGRTRNGMMAIALDQWNAIDDSVQTDLVKALVPTLKNKHK